MLVETHKRRLGMSQVKRVMAVDFMVEQYIWPFNKTFVVDLICFQVINLPARKFSANQIAVYKEHTSLF